MEKARALVDARQVTLSGGKANRWLPKDQSWCTGTYRKSFKFGVSVMKGSKGHKQHVELNFETDWQSI